MSEAGTIVVLNGVPRSGTSTIARAIQDSASGLWLNLGVDAFSHHVTPNRLRPGIGLRPGGERPDLERHLPLLFDTLYESVIAISELGPNVVVDVGHHDDYSRPLGILGREARRLADRPAFLVGVRCPLDVVMERRDAGETGRDDVYVTTGPTGAVPAAVLRWDRAVHDPGIYDIEVNTAEQSDVDCAAAILRRIEDGHPTAFSVLAGRTD